MSVVVRIRAWPRNAATGAQVAVRLAGGNNGAPHYDGQHYQSGVIADPRFEASISLDDEGWSARAVPQASAIGWMPDDASRLDAMAALYWRDAAIEIDRIKDGVTTRRLTGTIAEAIVRDGSLVITCADLSNRLDKPFVTATFAGTGGMEGGDFAIGRAKRRSFGRVWNVEGRLLDKANNIYEFGDPAFPLQDCSALRDKGRAGPLTILSWEGSAAATFAALQAAEPDQGGGVFAPSIACAKWWTQPSGPLTADLEGEAAAYAESAPEIAAQILAAAAGPSISNLGAAIALRPAPAGLHFGDTSETTAAALDRLLQRVTLIWVLTPTGDIEIRPWTFSAPVETLKATFIGRDQTLQPVSSRQVGYKKNERVHGDGEISIALLAGEILLEDGTPITQAVEAISQQVADQAPIISQLQLDLDEARETLLLNILTDAQRAEVLDARTLLEGQPVGTKILQERSERSDGQDAIAALIDLIGAKNAGGTAFVLNSDAVQVSPGQYLAQTLTDLGVVSEENSASVALLLSAVIGPEGPEATAIIKVDANGNMAGIRLGSGEQISKIGLVAGITTIEDEDGTILALFEKDGDGAYIPRLRVDRLKIGTKGSTNGGQVVTSGTAISGTGTSNYLTLISDTITLGAAGMIRAMATIAQSFPDGDATWNIKLRINNVEVFAAGGMKTQDVATVSGALYLPAGTYTVDVRWAAETSVSNHGKTLETTVLY